MDDPGRVLFQRLAKSLIQYINDYGNPHTEIRVTCDSAEILSGEHFFKTEEFIKD